MYYASVFRARLNPDPQRHTPKFKCYVLFEGHGGGRKYATDSLALMDF
jgi:hypothetical protein